MHLRIIDDDGKVLGELEADPTWPWLDLLTYVSGRWETQAVMATASALAALLATQQ